MRWALLMSLLALVGCHYHRTERSMQSRPRPRVTRMDLVRMLKAGQTEEQIIRQLSQAYLSPPITEWSPPQHEEVRLAGATETVLVEAAHASERPPVMMVEEFTRYHYNHTGPLHAGE